MSDLKVPKLINISNLTPRSRNFLMHFTDQQWKKAISKTKPYKGKEKNPMLGKYVISSSKLPGKAGYLAGAYFVDKKGKMYPVDFDVQRDFKSNDILCKPRTPGGDNSDFSCKTITRKGTDNEVIVSCIRGSHCNKGCRLTTVSKDNYSFSFCTCSDLARY